MINKFKAYLRKRPSYRCSNCRCANAETLAVLSVNYLTKWFVKCSQCEQTQIINKFTAPVDKNNYSSYLNSVSHEANIRQARMRNKTNSIAQQLTELICMFTFHEWLLDPPNGRSIFGTRTCHKCGQWNRIDRHEEMPEFKKWCKATEVKYD
ncbi:MAG: hypothetical protein V3V84_02470 [Candidatus Bathyarchaeia archaeon]